MYICTKCGEEKPKEQYSMILNRRKERVRNRQCKKCVSEYKKAHYEANREKYLKRSKEQYWSDTEYWSKYNRDYREKNKEQISKRVREYTSDPEVRKRINQRFRKYREDAEYRKKERARGMVNKRVQSGKIIKPDKCSKCGKRGYVEAHHDDYDKPLDVTWVCKDCHINIHYSNERHIS